MAKLPKGTFFKNESAVLGSKNISSNVASSQPFTSSRYPVSAGNSQQFLQNKGNQPIGSGYQNNNAFSNSNSFLNQNRGGQGSFFPGSSSQGIFPSFQNNISSQFPANSSQGTAQNIFNQGNQPSILNQGNQPNIFNQTSVNQNNSFQPQNGNQQKIQSPYLEFNPKII